uniref:RNase H type-1 domain-containing protein n=1 Tax=Trichogramma kaykai TaxID=54128 RepID=A0ABD2WKS3_9HYME
MMECYSEVWFLKDSIYCSDKHFKYTSDFFDNFFIPNIVLDSGGKISKDITPNDAFNKMYPERNCVNIFTDGSKIISGSRVGFAAWSSNPEYCLAHRISDSASIFTAECSALLLVIKKIITKGQGIYSIFYDSESVLKALSFFTSNSILINKIRQKLALAYQLNIVIKFVWIPSHVGIQSNEKADSLAKSAAMSENLLDRPIPVTDFTIVFKRKCNEENKTICINLSDTKGTFYFENFYSGKIKPWFAGIGLPRKIIVSINRLRSNHSSLKTSLFRKDIVNETLCACGQSDDSLDHIFWECELFAEPRKILCDNLRSAGKVSPYNVISLLKCDNRNIIYFIGKFLYDIECKI